MAKNYSTYWYQEDDQFRSAFLYNVRDRDIIPGGLIPKAAVIQGQVGFCISEAGVTGYSGRVVPFIPNRRCNWKSFELNCMCHPDIPNETVSKHELRRFNYSIADFSTLPEAAKLAEELKLPLLRTPTGQLLANLELDVFQRQGAGNVRRAKLVS